ncbi:unnamed protein product [Closterium sp. NIES-54]
MAAQELRWLTYLLTDLGEPPRSPPVLYVDNKAMLALCREHRLEHRTKHIALRYFLARELQQRGQLRLAYVASEANTADIFTKALPPGDHQRFCTLLGFPTWAMAAQELRLLTYLLTDYGERPRSSPVLYVDKKSMIALCQEHRLEHRTKHIALYYFLARDLQQRGQHRLAYVATRANTADIFTKALQSATGTRATGATGTLATGATGTRATGVTGSAANSERQEQRTHGQLEQRAHGRLAQRSHGRLELRASRRPPPFNLPKLSHPPFTHPLLHP